MSDLQRQKWRERGALKRRRKGIAKSIGFSSVSRFNFTEWEKKIRVYPTCKCGRKYVITREEQVNCLFCMKKTYG